MKMLIEIGSVAAYDVCRANDCQISSENFQRVERMRCNDDACRNVTRKWRGSFIEEAEEEEEEEE